VSIAALSSRHTTKY